MRREFDCYEQSNSSTNDAIVTAYESGGYTLKKLGDYFGLHYSTVSGISRIINQRPDRLMRVTPFFSLSF